MSNIIPPLLSDTPPPPPDINDHEDEDFDDFTGTNNLSYDCDDSYSPPGSPLQLPTEHFELDDSIPAQVFDINSNSKENIADPTVLLDESKDFHDKRKDSDGDTIENIVNNGLIQDPVLPMIANTIDNKHSIYSNNTAHFSIGSYKETDKSQDFTELKSNEIIATNCDTKTTSSQEEISSLSSKGNVEEPITDDFADFSSISENNTTSSYDFANSITSDIQTTLKQSNVSNEPLITSEELANNGSIKSTPKILENGSNNCSENSHHLKEELNESCLKSETDQIRENLKPNSEERGEELRPSCTLALDEQEIIKDVSKVTDTIEPAVNIAINTTDDDFGAFINNTGDAKEFDLAKDNFGNLTLLPSEIKSDTLNKLKENEIDDDDFGDFSSVAPSLEFQNTSNINVRDNSDFGEFATTTYTEISTNDKFEKFATFPSFSQNINRNHSTDDDDFGDFAISPTKESSESALFSKLMLLNENQALEKSTEIVKEMFPTVPQSTPDFQYRGLEVDDKIFDQIKNITDTHALSFQWPKSASQNLLLKALNIDSRNILYGPGWNPSMPRFAVNLSFTPLEPVKSEVLTPTPAKEPNSSNSNQSTVNVETVQFDSSEMGLADPLDYLEQLVAQLETPSFKNTSFSHNSSSPGDEFENWEVWLQSIPAKANNLLETSSNPSVPAVKLEPIALNNADLHVQGSKNDLEQKNTSSDNHDDFDDFVSYSTPTVQVSPLGHSIILRETHISNKEPSKGDENDIVSWLEPTIVTPELIRKERQFVEADDEFDEFPIVVVPENASGKVVESVNSLTVKPLEVLQPQSVVLQGNGLQMTALNPSFSESFNQNNFQNKELPKSELNRDPSIDDDFGDFTYSLPSEIKPVNTSIVQPPLLEPLKPSIIQTSNTASISWPDPGITDDEISRFEALGYARVQSQQFEPSKSTPVQKNSTELNKLKEETLTSHKSKQNSLDDEEWSDFVSGQNASPIHKLKAEKERSSTPDLPLSVLNLGNVQPAKQPIPVITPNGLVQTKLSSNMSLNIPNIMQQANRVYSQPYSHQNNQPSIISNQYATQAYGGFGNYGSKASADEDEWSDFVSHQPTVQKSTQPKPLQGWSGQSNHLANWVNTTPNIITNPAANYDIFGSSKNVSGPVQSRRGTGLPSVSVPDLDFLAPRNRTTQRK